MVVLPAGSFQMGLEIEELRRLQVPSYSYVWESPKHTVTVKSFAMGRYAVTKGEFTAFVRESGYEPVGCRVYERDFHPPLPLRGIAYSLAPHEEKSWRDPGFPQTERDPVVCVSWDDAQHYVGWLNSKVQGKNAADGDGPYHLPSESQWEYAARAGTTTVAYWGDDLGRQCEFANGGDMALNDQYPNPRNDPPSAPCRDGFAWTAPVGSYPPNPWGLFDMLGNVAQWTEDCWNHGYSEAPSDGSARRSGNCLQRVVRGGSWIAPLGVIRSASRGYQTVNERYAYIGFRVSKSMP